MPSPKCEICRKMYADEELIHETIYGSVCIKCLLDAEKIPKYEPHESGIVKKDGQVYVGRKHAGKQCEVYFLKDEGAEAE